MCENRWRQGRRVSLLATLEVLVSDERFEEAEAAFRQAVHICERSFPAAGSFRASLALLINLDSSSGKLVEVGKDRSNDSIEYVRFLCKRTGLPHGW